MPVSEVATGGTVPQWLLERGIVALTRPGYVTHPDCEHGCRLEPFLDDDGHILVECPSDPPCWEGRIELPPGAAEFIRVDGDAVAREIGAANTFDSPGDCDVPKTWYCGRRAFRGRTLLVYLTGDLDPDVVYDVSRKARTITHCHALLLHGGGASAVSKAAAGDFNVALRQLPGDPRWNFKLDLIDVYDQFTSGYLESRDTDNAFVFEDVTIDFACEPGRHVVKILGQVHPGFTSSDKYFSLLLLLAAHRAVDRNVYDGGWVDAGEVGIGEKRKELDDLLSHLSKWQGGHLPARDLRLLVRSNPLKDGTVRLALDPANITVHESVRDFRPLQGPGSSVRSKDTRRDGQKKHDDNMAIAAAATTDMVQSALRILCM